MMISAMVIHPTIFLLLDPSSFGGYFKFSSVCPSVRMSICNTIFSGLSGLLPLSIFFCMKLRLNKSKKKHKRNRFHFWRKILNVTRIEVNEEFLGPKMQKLKSFTKSVNWTFPKFYVITDIQKEVKVSNFDFSGKLRLCYPKSSSTCST